MLRASGLFLVKQGIKYGGKGGGTGWGGEANEANCYPDDPE